MTTQSVGRLGEQLAFQFLLTQRYTIVDQNYNVPQCGEIDIIAIDKDQLVFVEVKTRVGDQQTTALESITDQKLDAIKRTAYYYALEHANDSLPDAYSIDVVTVEFDDYKAEPIIEHFVNVPV